MGGEGDFGSSPQKHPPQAEILGVFLFFCLLLRVTWGHPPTKMPSPLPPPKKKSLQTGGVEVSPIPIWESATGNLPNNACRKSNQKTLFLYSLVFKTDFSESLTPNWSQPNFFTTQIYLLNGKFSYNLWRKLNGFFWKKNNCQNHLITRKWKNTFLNSKTFCKRFFLRLQKKQIFKEFLYATFKTRDEIINHETQKFCDAQPSHQMSKKKSFCLFVFAVPRLWNVALIVLES